MALVLDARKATEYLFRIWDTKARAYVSGDLSMGRTLALMRRLVREGGIADNPDTGAVVLGWIETAIRHGTNDPSEKPNADLERPWRNNHDPGDAAGPMTRAIWSRTLAEQVVASVADAVFDRRLAELSPDAQAFLRGTFVLQELRRGSPKATLRVERDPQIAPRAYRDLAHARSVVEEITTTWADAIVVDASDPLDPNLSVFTFRLR